FLIGWCDRGAGRSKFKPGQKIWLDIASEFIQHGKDKQAAAVPINAVYIHQSSLITEIMTEFV
ncbi:MAG: hypothetical protein AAFZ49_13495, partial [Cyanobacteria bacterium J06659_2]